MPEETDIEKLAEYALRFFQSKKKGEGNDAKTIYVLKERYPTWIFDMVKHVHDDGHWMPDDYKWEYVLDSLHHLSEGMDPDSPELEADVYTSDLMEWLSSHRERLGLVDEAVREFGWNEEGGIEAAISRGQWYEKEQVFHRVVEGLRDRLRDIEAGEREVFENRGETEDLLDWEP